MTKVKLEVTLEFDEEVAGDVDQVMDVAFEQMLDNDEVKSVKWKEIK